MLLDTHALLWWAYAPMRLSPRASAACDQVEQRGGLVSAISVWEIAAKLRRGRLEMPLMLDELLTRIERDSAIRILPVDTVTWRRTAELEWDHRDPADRVIVATAMLAGVPILTKDEAMHTQKLVECVW